MVSHYRSWDLPAKIHAFFAYSPFQHNFEYKWYNFELLRLFGSAPYGGCDAAEFLETIAKLRPNDALSWMREWYSLAVRTETLAKEATKAGHEATALSAYLRASNYFRCAQYMFPTMPARDQMYMLSLYDRSVTNFQHAIGLMQHEVRRVHIPFHTPEGEELSLPGWLHLPSNPLPARKTPTLICIGGADSTQEELYFLSVAEGPRLGYAVLTFDGPGQGLILRREGVPLRPDGEVVLAAVLDFLESYAQQHTETNLDLGAIAVTGQSLGAYLALRGAADPRIKACVAVDPIYDMWELAMSRMPGWIVKLWETNYIGDDQINWVGTTHGKYDVASRYMFAQAQGMLGYSSPSETLRAMKPFTFRLHGIGSGKREGSDDRDYLERIRCPVLVTGAAADPTMFLAGITTDKVMAGLTNVPEGQVELWMPKTYSEGGAQAKSGAWQVLQFRTYKFLDEKLGILRSQHENGVIGPF
ncbi:alpha/beta-hydrolase [Xylariaceae sp. AK1471]|nr:alpha/beta-hydrolase [Xylariaceae sp. AK1471]